MIPDEHVMREELRRLRREYFRLAFGDNQTQDAIDTWCIAFSRHQRPFRFIYNTRDSVGETSREVMQRRRTLGLLFGLTSKSR